MVNQIMHSLAARYAQVLEELLAISGKKVCRFYIVSGAIRNTFLNRLTAERTGFEIVVGAAESSTIGNLAAQLAALNGDCSSRLGVGYDDVTNWANQLLGSLVFCRPGQTMFALWPRAPLIVIGRTWNTGSKVLTWPSATRRAGAPEH